MRFTLFSCGMLVLFAANVLLAQEHTGYQLPPQQIIDLADAPATPSMNISPGTNHILFIDNPGLPALADLAAEELRLGGIRIDPATNGPSRAGYGTGLTLTDIRGENIRVIADLPLNPRIRNISWSPDENFIAFTHTTDTCIELWVVEVATAEARRLPVPPVNDAMGGAISWLSDSETLVYKAIADDRGPKPTAVTSATGPVIQESTGRKAAVRTYQDLISHPHEEAVFDYYTRAQLYITDVYGNGRTLGEPGIIWRFSPSPDAQYLFVRSIQKPYSYIVPYSRFPQHYGILEMETGSMHTFAQIPLADDIPQGFDARREGPRSVSWRADVPASLYWTEAIDGGDPSVEASFREQIFSLDAPFDGEPQALFTLPLRFSRFRWGNEDFALVREYWRKDRRARTYQFNPSETEPQLQLVFDHLTEDRYNDPGSFRTTSNAQGKRVLQFNNDHSLLYLSGSGASPEGNRPFLDSYNMATGETTRLWRSEAPWYEYVVSLLDTETATFISRRESNETPPNYYLRTPEQHSLHQITDFQDPFETLQKLQREVIHYERADGIPLNGILYLPEGFEAGKDEPLPTLLWAYPREFKSSDAAGQVSGSPHTYTRVRATSPVLLVTQGYAVLNNASFPIVGEGEEEPNNTFVEQLIMNAGAAIDKLVEMGVSDPEKMAVSGHSYGAFMTANLVAHSDLFATGIARSGAYNRSLTPFGFQSEERTYWQAPDIYNQMSPFMHADKVKVPLLLMHGADDNNSGTYPMQSERYYDALRGHGANARLVMFPHESHGYRARESVLHMHWEWLQWLDTYLKTNE